MLPTPGYARAAGPLAIAHRGGAALAPENTLAAFARATALGFRYLETDVRLTRDGELVCFHDERLDRVTEASGPVGRFSLRQLQELRVGGEPICTLREALAAFPAANFTVDLKDQAAIAPLAGVLADPGIAAVVLATPHTQHAEQAIAAAKAGKAVFVDKPFTLTRASAEAVVAACGKAGVTLAVGQNRRFLPSAIELKRMIDSG